MSSPQSSGDGSARTTSESLPSAPKRLELMNDDVADFSDSGSRQEYAPRARARVAKTTTDRTPLGHSAALSRAREGDQ